MKLKGDNRQIIRGLCKLYSLCGNKVKHNAYFPLDENIEYLTDQANLLDEYLEDETREDWKECIEFFVKNGWSGAKYKNIPPIPDILKALRGEGKYLEIAKKASKVFIKCLRTYSVRNGAYFQDDITNKVVYIMGGLPALTKDGLMLSDFEYSRLEKKFIEIYQDVAKEPDNYRSGTQFTGSHFFGCLDYIEDLEKLSLPTTKSISQRKALAKNREKLALGEGAKKEKPIDPEDEKILIAKTIEEMDKLFGL